MRHLTITILKESRLGMTLRRRELFTCTFGVLFAIGTQIYLHARGMQHYIFLSSNTGIAAEKHLFLDYFVVMPWPIVNFDNIAYFREIYYLGHLYEPDTVPVMILFKSIFFFLGALLAMVLSGRKKRPLNEVPQWTQWRGISLPPLLFYTIRSPPPWVLYTFLLFSAHLLLMGAATTYYTGPGGPVWVYPSPLLLIPFVVGLGVISFFTQFICTILQEGINFRSLLLALGTYVALIGLYYIIFRCGCAIAWSLWH